MSADSRSRRALVIFHPDFDKPGPAGILAAKQYGEFLVEGFKAVVADPTTDAGDNAAELKEYAAGFVHRVRLLPGDI